MTNVTRIICIAAIALGFAAPSALASHDDNSNMQCNISAVGFNSYKASEMDDCKNMQTTVLCPNDGRHGDNRGPGRCDDNEQQLTCPAGTHLVIEEESDEYGERHQGDDDATCVPDQVAPATSPATPAPFTSSSVPAVNVQVITPSAPKACSAMYRSVVKAIGPRELSMSSRTFRVFANTRVTQVRFYVDGIRRHIDSSRLFTYKVSASLLKRLAPGRHQIAFYAYLGGSRCKTPIVGRMTVVTK